MEAYVWVSSEGCRRLSVSCGCRGSWVPPGERWWRSCRSRCCLRPPRRGWCWRWGCWGAHRSPGTATPGLWRPSPWWCWAPRTATVWGRCLEADTVQNALKGQGKQRITVINHIYVLNLPRCSIASGDWIRKSPYTNLLIILIGAYILYMINNIYKHINSHILA